MKTDQIKTVNRTINIVTDVETGEVIDTSIKEVKVLINTDDFALVYAGLWNVILQNPLSKSDIELFSYLINNYSDGTPFTINSYTKEEISKKSGKATTSYNKSTAALLKHQLIYSVQSRVYKINPKFAFAGSSKNRHKAVIEMTEICKTC
jgi:hypothetical protein